jgi:hypothetical protein
VASSESDAARDTGDESDSPDNQKAKAQRGRKAALLLRAMDLACQSILYEIAPEWLAWPSTKNREKYRFSRSDSLSTMGTSL